MPPKASDVPSAITVRCPECGEETLHRVLKGRQSRGARYVLEATVECETCGHVHPTVVREAHEVEIPTIVSKGSESRRTRLPLRADETVAVGDVVIVEERNTKIMAIERDDKRRVERATAGQISTLWAMDWETVSVPFGVNLGKKTITKREEVPPETTYEIGQRLILGRLEVEIKSIKTRERIVNRGSIEAADIQRVNTKPVERPKPYRPPKPEREARRRAWEEK